MGRKEARSDESPEEKRIACRERFQEAITIGNFSALTSAVKEYAKCGADNLSVLSLIKEGFDWVSESCHPKSGSEDPTSWKDWQFSYSFLDAVGAMCGFFAQAGKIFYERYNSAGESARQILDYMMPLFNKILSVTDAGELILTASNLEKTVNSLQEIRKGDHFVGTYDREGNLYRKFLRFERNFRDSARKALSLEKENAVEGKCLLKLWLVAHRYFELGEDYDRDCAWATIGGGIRLARAELLNPEKSSEVLVESFWFLSSSANFDFSENGDFTLFEEAKSLVESALIVCPIDRLFEEDRKRLMLARQTLYAMSRIDSNPKRIIQEIKEVVEELDEFISNRQKKAVEQPSAKTTLLARLTGRLTRSMKAEASDRPTATLKEGSVLHFSDGSSAKVLQVFSGGETDVYEVENNVGRVCAMRVYHGENKRKDFGAERGRFVNALRSRVSEQARGCIPEVYDYKVAKEGTVYVTQEFIEGKNLETVPKPMPAEEIRQTAISLASTLFETHQNLIAHLDIKPGNSIMKEDGKAALVDWDLAKKFGENYPQKKEDRKGTLGYVSPEVCLGIGKVDGSADIYSFGVTLYEFFTGETQAVSSADPNKLLFMASFEQRFPKVGQVPEKWRGIIKNCTDLNPLERPTAEELLQMLS